MTASYVTTLSGKPSPNLHRNAFWILLLIITWATATWSFELYKLFDARWIIKFPANLMLPLDEWISAAMNWLVEDATFGLFTFRELTRFISTLIEIPYNAVRAVLLEGIVAGQGQQAVQLVPQVSWIGVILVFTIFAYYLGGTSLSVFVFTCFFYLAVFGQWESAMVTLVSVIISVPLGILGGIATGIVAFKVSWIERIIRPVLDLMQTVPVFAYLVPILFLFGFGPISALVATIIYAMPPMIRVTILALQGVSSEITEAGRMMGCTKRQMLWRILLPSANPTLMVGVNQVIMLSLNMVIIASMIGAGGLGYDVLTALRRLDIGGGIEAGIAIVVMAIALDRLSQAFAKQNAGRTKRVGEFEINRTRLFLILVAIVVVTTLLGQVISLFAKYPEKLIISTSAYWAVAIEWINVNYFDTFESIKSFLLTWLLLPVKRFLTSIPWLWGIVLITLATTRIGGWRFGSMSGLMAIFIAMNGVWTEAMISVYLCGVSVIFACILGIPIGILAGQNLRLKKIVDAIMDTLQTLPSFVYLIPVVMLFRVGDFSAMIAVVLYALAPVVRYSAHGISSIEPEMLESGRVSGCTRLQLLLRVKLPLAAPAILLGLNQTIMLAISMLVITALVGTRDLGQEVYIALTRANTGLGIVAGLSVAFIAIISDRILSIRTRHTRQRLGLV